MNEPHYRYIGARICCADDCHHPADYVVVDSNGDEMIGEFCYGHASQQVESMKQELAKALEQEPADSPSSPRWEEREP